jgi:hypothetical protein
MLNYLIVDNYETIKEQSGIEDDRAVAILTAAHFMASCFALEDGTSMADGLYAIAHGLKALNDTSSRLETIIEVFRDIRDAMEGREPPFRIREV